MSNADSPSWIGVDIGASKTLIVRMNDDGSVADSSRIESLRDHGPRPLLDRIAATVKYRVTERPSETSFGIGIGFAGLVDAANGTVRSSIMLPGWDGFPLASELSERLALPVNIDNDATTAGLGEYRVRGAPPSLTMALLTIGTGIGGALIVEGELFRGATGLSAEFGNMSIDWKGDACWFGSRGCLNTLASGSAIEARYQSLSGRAGPQRLTEVAKRAAEGDANAARAIEEGARTLGAGVANLINFLNPDLIVLAGGVARLGGDYLSSVRTEARSRSFRESFDHARIELAEGGYEVGALRAAHLVRDALRREAAR